MPTSDRRRLAAQSILYFLRQDYPNRELVIVDDGVDAILDVIPNDRRIRYVRLPHKSTLGDKRNLACETSRGTIIAHWDDDDWCADWRLSYQVGALLAASGKSVCGLRAVLFYEPGRDRAWCYTYPEHRRPWVAGATLCYYKSAWEQNRFAPVDQGEDARFVWSLPESVILPVPDHRFYVATLHSMNSSPRTTSGPWWRMCPDSSEVRKAMDCDFVFYENWPLPTNAHIFLRSTCSVQGTAGSAESEKSIANCVMRNVTFSPDHGQCTAP